MNSKRSMWKLLVGVASVGLLVTNCTIKTDDDDAKAGSSNSSAGAGNAASGECTPGKKVIGCTCAGNLTSYQLCTSEGIYGACVCDDTSGGGASSYAGATSYGGTSSDAGSAGVDAAEGGAGGDAGLEIDPADCPSCLAQRCADEWDACADDNETTTIDPNGAYCLSQGANAKPGQIEDILDCINTERFNGLVKRDAVRACGSSLGASADPTAFFTWPPSGMKMTPATEGLMNCMADKFDEVDNPGAWANDPSNFPASGPRPWDDMTCAKLACTSQLTPP